jgi:hypothetical protein
MTVSPKPERRIQRTFILKLRDFFRHHDPEMEEEVMECRKCTLTVALIAGAAALTFVAAQAAPMPPILSKQSIEPTLRVAAEPAVISQDEIDRIRPVEMRWGHHGHHWGHRHWGHHWGWRHRHWGWRHRHWGWRHHHWHHRHWHRHWW